MTKIRNGRRNRSRGRTAISRRRIGYGIGKPKGKVVEKGVLGLVEKED